MSYMIAAVIVGSAAPMTATQYGPFTDKATCQVAARDIVKGGTEMTESDELITAKMRIETGAMTAVVFYYRLSCVRL